MAHRIKRHRLKKVREKNLVVLVEKEGLVTVINLEMWLLKRKTGEQKLIWGKWPLDLSVCLS